MPLGRDDKPETNLVLSFNFSKALVFLLLASVWQEDLRGIQLPIRREKRSLSTEITSDHTLNYTTTKDI